jgi:hypothetical protein
MVSVWPQLEGQTTLCLVRFRGWDSIEHHKCEHVRSTCGAETYFGRDLLVHVFKCHAGQIMWNLERGTSNCVERICIYMRNQGNVMGMRVRCAM